MTGTYPNSRRPYSRSAPALALVILGANLAACSAVDRLQNIGQEPALSAITNPQTQVGYRPVQMPMPVPEPVYYAPNSLWQTGSRAFFRDQRARRVGDILTVHIKITDKAEFENTTTRSRTNSEDLGLDAIAGFDTPLLELLPTGANAGGLIDLDSDASSRGAGTIKREEELTTSIAAVVTQVLPNGNMVIEGRQEIRVNYEIREMIIAGVVRPEDIGNDNIIPSDKIAEARISYGGRGHISDVQQPRYGQQVLDILLPF